MKLFLQRQFINIILVIALTVMMSCAYLAYKQIEHLQKTNDWVIHTYQTINAADDILYTLASKKAHATEVLFSGNRDEIIKLPSGSKEILAKIEHLQELTVDNPAQQYLIQQLKNTLIQRRQIFNDVLHEYLVKGKPIIAIAFATSKQRSELSDKTMTIVENIKNNELILLKIRDVSLSSDTDKRNFMLATFTILSFLLLMTCFILLNYHLSLRYRAEKIQQEAELKLIKTNRKLKESEDRFNTATEGGNAGLWDWDYKSNAVYFSPQFKTMLGYSDYEFPDTIDSFNNAIHPDDAEKTKTLVKMHLEMNLPFDTEYRLKLKSGEYRWFRAVGVAKRDSTGQPIRMAGSLMDIHERKRIQQSIELQYSLTKILANALSLKEAAPLILSTICDVYSWKFAVMWALTSESDLMKCATIWQSPKIKSEALSTIAKTIQVKRGDGLLGQIWKDPKPSWLSDISLDKNQQHVALAEAAHLHSAYCFPIFLKGTVIGIIELMSVEIIPMEKEILDTLQIIGTQIGELIQRKWTELELRKSEAHNAAVLDSTLDGIITLNKNGDIVSFNSQTTRILKYTQKDLKNKNINILMDNLTEILPKIMDKSIAELTVRDKNGDEIPIEITASTIRLNEQSGSVLFIRDNRERKKIETQKNDFIDTVSNEFTTPLKSIQGSLDLLANASINNLPDERKQLLKTARQNCESLIKLIHHISSTQRID